MCLTKKVMIGRQVPGSQSTDKKTKVSCVADRSRWRGNGGFGIFFSWRLRERGGVRRSVNHKKKKKKAFFALLVFSFSLLFLFSFYFFIA